MIELLDFQLTASSQITERYTDFMKNRPMWGTSNNFSPLPFYQALSSVTASGKTIILADVVSKINSSLAVKPIILWLSKGRIVVSQTYLNLQDGGKYRHIISDLDVSLLSEYNQIKVEDSNRGQMFFATVGTFNQKDKEHGERLIYQSEIDTAERSIWEALKERINSDKIRRPLIIVYDEGHNLSDQQTSLLMELEPDALLLASATMRLPKEILKVVKYLETQGWTNERLITLVPSLAVANSGLIKSEISLGGYAAPMEKTIDDMLKQLDKAQKAAKQTNTKIVPKAIYVSKTNIIEGNSFKKDDPKRIFLQREAPPILIWRHLVYEKNIDPATIAVYCSLEFDKNYPAPSDFKLFKGGDKDYEQFIAGRFQHIIFNQSLQEGWDDPECYFAYIDKSMGSNVQVEQIIGRVLRQPEAKHYSNEILNTAHFYVRVDSKNVFSEIVQEVQLKLSTSAPEVTFTTFESTGKTITTVLSPKEERKVPAVYLDATNALQPIAELINQMTDYRNDRGENTIGQGSHAVVQQKIGSGEDMKWKWIPYHNNNRVSARWAFQLAVMKRYPKALQVTPSDDQKFDAMVEFGSRAYMHIEELAGKVVDTYLNQIVLKTNPHNPYLVGDVNVDEKNLVPFNNSLHKGYSGLNKLELAFAHALDKLEYTWARNPVRSGFGIPLLSLGSTNTFYPDFLVWHGKSVIGIDTTGGHLVLEKTGRKLLSITHSKKVTVNIILRLISVGKWNDSVQEIEKTGYTIWSLKNDQTLRAIHCLDINEAISVCLKS